MSTPASDHPFWIFGYGSLIWKPPSHVAESVPGYIKGCVRRFWSSSNDHRGTPENPGRVVTLISADHWRTLDDPHPYGADDLVWGMAYRISDEKKNEVRAELDYREKHGYTDHIMKFFPQSGKEPFDCLVYMVLPDNPAFVGPQNPEDLAKLIAKSIGPSGTNIEYVRKLDKALFQLTGQHDKHITDIMQRADKYL